MKLEDMGFQRDQFGRWIEIVYWRGDLYPVHEIEVRREYL